jgi:hypothetical protein
MLTACAPSFGFERKKHHFWVYYNGLVFRGLPTGEEYSERRTLDADYNGLVFRGLPTGEHGGRNPVIQIGIIRQMIRQLGVELECAKRHLPLLQ